MRSVSRIGERPSSRAPDDVVEDELVALLVARERGVELLDARRRSARRRPEAGLAHDERCSNGRCAAWLFAIDGEADRPELHLGDRMMPVAPLRRRRQTDDVARLHLGQHALERDRRAGGGTRRR